MKNLYTPAESKIIDEVAINQFKIPSEKLMERAGSEIYKTIKKYFKVIPKNILIVCGKGNNGGDGLVVARKLIEDGFTPKIFLTENISDCSNDLKAQFKKINKKHLIEENDFFKIQKSDLIIDAIFGVSFSGNLNIKYQKIINKINNINSKVVSIDIPSGLNAVIGKASPVSVRSFLTTQIELPKVGLYINESKDLVGKLETVKIGIPENAKKKVKSNYLLIDKNFIKINLPARKNISHKYSVGKIFALCASRGLTGASILATSSAMRSGAGAVILGIPETEFEIVAKRTLEVMPFPLGSTKQGSLSLKSYPKIIEKLKWCDVLLIGPGLSQNKETQKLIRKIISNFSGKILIDADGINAFVENLKILEKKENREIIITPHIGEFSRLIKKSTTEILINQIELSKSFVKKYRLTLVLKSSSTIIADKNGNIFVNPFGNSGMATAGSGDCLSGIISSLWAQGGSEINSAICGVGLHSISGDIAKKKKGEFSIIAEDLIHYLPNAFKNL